MISIEEGANWDTSINNLATNNGFEFTSLDAINGRSQNIRSGFSYYRGIDSSGSPFTFPFSERRRIAIIDNTDPENPIIKYNAVPDSDSLTEDDVSSLETAINSIQAAPAGLNFDEWRETINFKIGQNGENDDPDHDGSSNLFEFFSGTDPLDPRSISLGRITHQNGLAFFTYRVATNRIGINHKLESGPLSDLVEFSPNEQETTTLDDQTDQITIPLPSGTSGFIRQRITIEP